jgi:hypothetical protein
MALVKPLHTYDLYGPVRNVLIGKIQYVGKWEGDGPWKWRVFWVL